MNEQQWHEWRKNIKWIKENDKCAQCDGVLKYNKAQVAMYENPDRQWEVDEPRLECNKCPFNCYTGEWSDE